MPVDKDIKKVLIIGSGPIQIGQAAEFDYSGSQACKSLREEGIETVLVNSNPATIQTDMDMADVVYTEPLTPELVKKIIDKEKVDAILPTMGGQTGLNIATGLGEKGLLDGIKVIGSDVETIANVEDRDLFALFMDKLNEPIPKCHAVESIDEALEAIKDIGYPAIVRPAFTLGGTGGGIANNEEELIQITQHGLDMSFIGQVLIDESVLGWKEFEYEVMRDKNDTCIIVCNMENIDPMGIHTGESVVVAPAQTLEDKYAQRLRDASIKIIRALGINGGCNIQFAVNPETGEYKVIEVNPRVSRSSALASKATGYPIAKISSKVALGLTLDEIKNDITKETPASFEPSIDYVVVKVPRWPFDKFKGISREIGVQMKATGEVMAIGRTFEEAFQKALRSLDLGFDGFEDIEYTKESLEHPDDERFMALYSAIKDGMDLMELSNLTQIDTFFLDKIENIVNFEKDLSLDKLKSEEYFRRAKQLGFTNKRLAVILGVDTDEINKIQEDHNIITGPIRIGQGIEFDYCCVHSSLALKDQSIETILINNNPETVSTDYDISDKLFFEPLSYEDVMNIIKREKPDGVIVQFGGQTSINLAVPLANAGVKILGTPYDSIDIAEDRDRFSQLLSKLNIYQAPFGIVHSYEKAKEEANRIGYPVLVRPSYVIGGRAMEIVYDDSELEKYMKEAVKVSPEHPILVDKFLEDAIELDVDVLADGEDVFIAGIMEHIEEAGVHSGDSACVIPPHIVPKHLIDEIKENTRKIALELNVVGLMNIQYAVKLDTEMVYIIEANPRASRTVPFVSKAIGVPIAKIATLLMTGHKLKDFGLTDEIKINHVAVKESVFPFLKLSEADTILGPEMKSTGEAIGIDEDVGMAFYKSQLSAGMDLPQKGKIFISVRDKDQKKVQSIAKKAHNLGFELCATRGTAEAIRDVPVEKVKKVSQGTPNIRDQILDNKIDMIINTSYGKQAARDGYIIRRLAIELGIPYVTTLAGARAALYAIKSAVDADINVKSLNDYAGGNFDMDLKG